MHNYPESIKKEPTRPRNRSKSTLEKTSVFHRIFIDFREKSSKMAPRAPRGVRGRPGGAFGVIRGRPGSARRPPGRPRGSPTSAPGSPESPRERPKCCPGVATERPGSVRSKSSRISVNFRQFHRKSCFLGRNVRFFSRVGSFLVDSG